MAAYEEFKGYRIVDERPKAQFLDTMPKKRLLESFSDIRKKTSASNLNNDVPQADRNIFASMVLMAESRRLPMSGIISYSLVPLPWALVNGDCTLRTINKTALVRQKHVLPADTILEPSVAMTHGMSLVQKTKANDQTFSQLTESALTHILHERVGIHRIDVVFDVYREDSINNGERLNWNTVAKQEDEEDDTCRFILQAAHAVQQTAA